MKKKGGGGGRWHMRGEKGSGSEAWKASLEKLNKDKETCKSDEVLVTEKWVGERERQVRWGCGSMVVGRGGEGCLKSIIRE